MTKDYSGKNKKINKKNIEKKILKKGEKKKLA